VETGESDEERAEDAVGEQILGAHEGAATRFLLLSGGVLLLMAAGFLPGQAGRAGRTLASVAALALIIAGYQVGHTGGRVVYGDGSSPGISSVGPGTGEDGGRNPASTRDNDDE
jgi:hypothetical protein